MLPKIQGFLTELLMHRYLYFNHNGYKKYIVTFLPKTSKGLFHQAMEETSAEGFTFYHHQWIVIQTKSRSNLAPMLT